MLSWLKKHEKELVTFVEYERLAQEIHILSNYSKCLKKYTEKMGKKPNFVYLL